MDSSIALLSVNDPATPNITAFAAAGLFLITISSTAISTERLRIDSPLSLSAFVVWALSASAFLHEGRSFPSAISTLTPRTPIYVFAVITMLYLLDKLWARIRNRLAVSIAKRTILWKLFHVHRGTYKQSISELHVLYGSLIQVSPREYSISDPAFFERCAALGTGLPAYSHNDTTSKAPLYRLLTNKLDMANVFGSERSIEACNKTLIDLLAKHAVTGETVRLSDIMASYAYDLMFATTTGASPGFLARPVDAGGIRSAMLNWKLYSILYGSYLRFHPLIDRLLKLVVGKPDPIAHISERLPKGRDIKDRSFASLHTLAEQVGTQDDVDLRTPYIALILAGANPVITHMLIAIYHLYRDPELLQAVRKEIADAHIYQPPRFKYLFHCKQRLPILHAVLQETLRLYLPETNSNSYVVPEGGVVIGEDHVPEGCTICIEPSVAHVNPNIFGHDAEAWNPARWLQDPTSAALMRSHMLAFGAGLQRCPGEDLHYALIIKLLVTLLPNINLDMAASQLSSGPHARTFGELRDRVVVKVSLPKTGYANTPMSPLRAEAPAFAPETTTAPELPPGLATPSKATFDFFGIPGVQRFKKYISALQSDKVFVPTGETATTYSSSGQGGASPTLSTASTLGGHLSVSIEDRELLEKLLGRRPADILLQRFDPTQQLSGRPPVRSRPIPGGAKRCRAHEAIDRIWEGRLAHDTDERTNIIWIKLQNPANIKAVNVASTRNKPIAQTASVARQAPPALHGAWGAFADGEDSSYTAKKAKEMADARDPVIHAANRKRFDELFAEHQAARKEGPPIAFQQTFKQTSRVKTTDGKLGRPRKYLNVVQVDDTGKATAENAPAERVDEGVALPDTTTTSEQPAAKKPKPAVIPPHLRKRTASPTEMTAPTEMATPTEITTPTTEWCAARLPSMSP